MDNSMHNDMVDLSRGPVRKPACNQLHALRHVSRASRPRWSRGFTLIELLLVMVILAILAAVVVPRFTNRAEQAKQTAAMTDISNIGVALDAYEVDCGRYPTSDESLAALVTAPPSAQGWKGPYLKKGMPKDAWGNDYQYRCPGQHNTNGYDLFSFGTDGREGGGDDIDSWSSK
jgi:general secretion pathway protein G